MSAEPPFTARIVSPVKCNEKPWDLWVSEIGHSSPTRDEPAAVFAAPAEVDKPRRVPEPHPYKTAAARPPSRCRRARLNRLKHETMSLHGILPEKDPFTAAVCHMCGVTVKCSAVYRHLLESHTSIEPIRPPPPPAPTVKLKTHGSRSRHKKEAAPPSTPIDNIPIKMETSPIHTATAPLSRIVMPQPELQYLDEASTSSGVTGEVQVCVESGELPVVSIQDPDDLPLGENITDIERDIFAIMTSEGIQAEWKNIIRDIGTIQDITFSQPVDQVPSQEMYTPVDTTALAAYTMTDTDLSNLQFANTSPMLSAASMDALDAQALKPVAPTTPSSKSRSKSSKSKFNVREYDPNKHCGVTTPENPKPCTRSLTCKAHALSLRRQVEGRIKSFDMLLAEHRASRDPAAKPAPPAPPALLVNATIDLSAFSGLAAEQQVNDIYASLLSVDDPTAALPDTSSITSLLSQPLPEPFLLPDDATITQEVPILSIASPPEEKPVKTEPPPDDGPPPLIPSDVCWYQSSPRPLALCTYNTAHAGGAITLGKRFATVRSNIKSSLSRSNSKASGSSNSYYFGQNSLALSKTVHMNNATKSSKPEVRKLVVTCSATGGSKEYGELFGATVNGHVARRGSVKAKRTPGATVLDLGFVLDPLLADEKC